MSRIIELLDKFPDSVRHPQICENKDWEGIISPALTEMGTVLFAGRQINAGTANILRVMFEIVYILGDRHGQQRKAMPEFIMAEGRDRATT